jgi:hypothetical protein
VKLGIDQYYTLHYILVKVLNGYRELRMSTSVPYSQGMEKKVDDLYGIIHHAAETSQFYYPYSHPENSTLKYWEEGPDGPRLMKGAKPIG